MLSPFCQHLVKRTVKNRVIAAKALHLESEDIKPHVDSTYSTFETLNNIPNLNSFTMKYDNNIEPLCKSLDARHALTIKRQIIQRIIIIEDCSIYCHIKKYSQIFHLETTNIYNLTYFRGQESGGGPGYMVLAQDLHES